MTDRIPGVVIGIVSEREDEDGLGRLKVRFPWMADEPQSTWCRVAAPLAGASNGAYLPPEEGDEALVAFEHGDINRPYIVGYLWSGENGVPTEEIDQRMIRTPKGHTITFDDRDGEEAVIIEDSNDNKITMNQDGIVIESAKDVTIKAQNVNIEAEAEVKVVGNPINLNP